MEHLLLADLEEGLAPALDGRERLGRQVLLDPLLERGRREDVLEHHEVLELGGLAERVDQGLPMFEAAQVWIFRAPTDIEHGREGALWTWGAAVEGRVSRCHGGRTLAPTRRDGLTVAISRRRSTQRGASPPAATRDAARCRTTRASQAWPERSPPGRGAARGPRARPIVDGFGIWRIVFVGLGLLALTLWAFFWAQSGGASDDLSRTVAVNALVLGQVFYLLNSRFKLDSSLSLKAHRGNRYLPLGIGAVVVLQILFTYVSPFQALFDTVAMPLSTWPPLFVAAVVFLLVVEVEKFILRSFGAARRTATIAPSRA